MTRQSHPPRHQQRYVPTASSSWTLLGPVSMSTTVRLCSRGGSGGSGNDSDSSRLGWKSGSPGHFKVIYVGTAVLERRGC